MKTKQLIFAMCCVAAMASCSNEEPLTEVTQQAKQVSLTLTYGDGADTRTSFKVSDTGLEHVWTAGDKVHLSYSGSSGLKTFGILELSTGAGTKTATFSGEISDWADGETKKIDVKYGPLNADNTEMDWSTQEGKLESLGKYEIIYYPNVVATLNGDKISVSEIQSTIYKSTFIYLPKGLKILESGSGEATLSMESSQFASKHHLSSNDWTRAASRAPGGVPITAPVTLENGNLASDVYLAACSVWNGSNDVSFGLSFGEKNYQVNLNKTFENGMLYTVTQSVIDAVGGFQETK
ncbi:MAG: hypothetical protein ILA03_03025 [Bacteroidaceae bacterium]|nr:hypothetical protein [Bacteroidaceae bacterium]MBP3832917.1 hypothetical protein [Bacteroidaceae bacterium]